MPKLRYHIEIDVEDISSDSQSYRHVRMGKIRELGLNTYEHDDYDGRAGGGTYCVCKCR